MRYSFVFVLVLGVMPMVGCTDDGPALCEGVTCDDEDDCTDDACNPADGECVFTALCDEDDNCSCTERGILCAIEAGGGPYTFDCDGPTTITTTAEVVIDNDVTLDGEGNMTIDANDEHRVFSVPADVVVELRGLTMTRGSNEGFGLDGGAVLNAGTLTISDCTVSESIATGASGLAGKGGGVHNDGVLTLADSTVSHNEANGGAGVSNQIGATLTISNSVVADNVGVGISARGTVTVNDSTVSGNSDSGLSVSAELTMARTTVSGNSADKDGGGLAVHGGTATVTDSTFSENSAVGFGGGVYHSGELSLTNCRVADNIAGSGGGLYHYLGTAELVTTTVSRNSARDEGGGIYGHSPVALDGSTVEANLARAGGGVYGGGTFVNSTISGNEAETAGGGMLLEPMTTLTHSTVASNVAPESDGLHGPLADSVMMTGTLIEGTCDLLSTVSNGYNIESSGNTCGLDHPTDRVDVSWTELELGPLQDNGGPTRTHLPSPTSPAVNAIPTGDCNISTDQRGIARPQGSGCDVGAVEVETP